tara:strand:+ start:2106 stop:3236 length:1131 start_codon:yes stop_codon:yes gene_type:complete
LERKIFITDIYLRKTFDIFNILNKKYKKEQLVLLTDKINWLVKLNCYLIYGSANLCLLRKGNLFQSDLANIESSFPQDMLIYIPIEEETTLQFYKYLGSTNSKILYLLPEENMFNISRDKERLNKFCMSNAIDCPKYIDESSLRSGVFNYPIIIKPKTGSGAKGIRYIENKEQLQKIVINFRTCFVQELLPNSRDIEGGFFLCEQGKIISYYSHKRLRTYPEKGGVTVYSVADDSINIKQSAKKLIKKLNWSGLLMVEYLYDKRDNKYKLIEINPRLWGSVLLSEFCNANLLTNYIALLKQNEKIINTRIEKKFIRWVFPYDIIFFIKHLPNPLTFFKIDKNTCYINFTYSSFSRSFFFIVLNYFNLRKILKIIKS